MATINKLLPSIFQVLIWICHLAFPLKKKKETSVLFARLIPVELSLLSFFGFGDHDIL